MSFILYDREPSSVAPTDPQKLRLWNATATLSGGWCIALIGPNLAFGTLHQGGVGVGAPVYLADGSQRTIVNVIQAGPQDSAIIVLDKEVPFWVPQLPESLRKKPATRAVYIASGKARGDEVKNPQGKLVGWSGNGVSKQKCWADIDPTQPYYYNQFWGNIGTFKPVVNSMAVTGDCSCSPLYVEVDGQWWTFGATKGLFIQASTNDPKIGDWYPAMFDGVWLGGAGYSYGATLAQALDSDVAPHMPKPGDANSDGVVNFTDLLLLAQNYNRNGMWATGDFNGDGFVDLDDLTKLSQNYTSTNTIQADFAKAQQQGNPVMPTPPQITNVTLVSAAGVVKMSVTPADPAFGIIVERGETTTKGVEPTTWALFHQFAAKNANPPLATYKEDKTVVAGKIYGYRFIQLGADGARAAPSKTYWGTPTAVVNPPTTGSGNSGGGGTTPAAKKGRGGVLCFQPSDVPLEVQLKAAQQAAKGRRWGLRYWYVLENDFRSIRRYDNDRPIKCCNEVARLGGEPLLTLHPKKGWELDRDKQTLNVPKTIAEAFAAGEAAAAQLESLGLDKRTRIQFVNEPNWVEGSKTYKNNEKFPFWQGGDWMQALVFVLAYMQAFRARGWKCGTPGFTTINPGMADQVIAKIKEQTPLIVAELAKAGKTLVAGRITDGVDWHMYGGNLPYLKVMVDKLRAFCNEIGAELWSSECGPTLWQPDSVNVAQTPDLVGYFETVMDVYSWWALTAFSTNTNDPNFYKGCKLFDRSGNPYVTTVQKDGKFVVLLDLYQAALLPV